MPGEAEQQHRTVFAAHSLTFYTVPPAGLEGIIVYLTLASPVCLQFPPGLIFLKLGL